MPPVLEGKFPYLGSNYAWHFLVKILKCAMYRRLQLQADPNRDRALTKGYQFKASLQLSCKVYPNLLIYRRFIVKNCTRHKL